MVDDVENPLAWHATCVRDEDGFEFQYLISYGTLEWRALEYGIDVEEIAILLEIVLHEFEETVGGPTGGIVGDDIHPYDFEVDEANALYAEWLATREPLTFAPGQSIEGFAEEVANNHLANSDEYEFRKAASAAARADTDPTLSNQVLHQAAAFTRQGGITAEDATMKASINETSREIREAVMLNEKIARFLADTTPET